VCRENNWPVLTTNLRLVATDLAEDGFHPSASGCDRLGRDLARALLALRSTPGPAIPGG
jgi:lysophospholipase L1-like esterase